MPATTGASPGEPQADPSEDRLHGPQSVRTNFLYVALGRGSYAICLWGLLVALAKLGGAEMVGLYALGVAICTPAFTLANLKLDQVYITDARNEYAHRDYVLVRVFTSAAALVVIAGVVSIGGYASATAMTVLLIGVGQGILSVREIVLAEVRKSERMGWLALSNSFLGATGLFAFAVTLWLTRQLIPAVLALAAARIALLLLDTSAARAARRAVYGTRERRTTHLTGKVVGQLVKISVPLGIVATLLCLNGNVPRYFIEGLHGKAALGYFAALASLPMSGAMVVTSLGQAASPRLAKYYARNRHAYRVLLMKMLAVGLLIGLTGVLIAVLFGEPLLTLFFAPDYAKHNSVLVWLVVAWSLLYLWSFLEQALTASRHFRVQVPIYGLALCAGLLSCILLVRRYHLTGAAIALVVSNAVGMTLMAAGVAYAMLKPSPLPEADGALHRAPKSSRISAQTLRPDPARPDSSVPI